VLAAIVLGVDAPGQSRRGLPGPASA